MCTCSQALASMDYQSFLLNLSELFIFDDNDVEDEDLIRWIMSMGEPSIYSIQMMKDRGNSLFKEDNFSLAISLYKQALNLLCFLGFSPFHDQHTTSSLALSLILNLAACELKLSHYNQACSYCNFVLKFDPCNVKAYYRRGFAYKQSNFLKKAMKDFEQVVRLDPNNKEANRELLAVVDRLVVYPNGNRVASVFDPLNTANKGKKPLFSAAAVDKCEIASCSNVTMLNNAVVDTHQGDEISSVSTMDFDSNYEADPSLRVDDKDSTSHSFTAKPTTYTFSKKKQSRNKLHLSSEDYENLLLGRNLQFFHRGSLSYLRVRPLVSKNSIQTGTPHEENSREAVVPSSVPLYEEHFKNTDFNPKSTELVQEEVILQVDKKIRLSPDLSLVSKVSLVQFHFAALKENFSKSRNRKLVHSYCHGRVARDGVNLRKRSQVTTVNRSVFLCRYFNNVAAAKSTKRKEADMIQFEDYFHPPFKKCRFSVNNSCDISSSVCCTSSSYGVSSFPQFVL